MQRTERRGIDETTRSNIPVGLPLLAEYLSERYRMDRMWWALDNEHFLSQLIDVPCPGDELAAKLRDIQREDILPLCLSSPKADSEPRDLQGLKNLIFVAATKLADGTSEIPFRWTTDGEIWLLAEDPSARDEFDTDPAGGTADA